MADWVGLWCFSSLISIEYLSLLGLVEFLSFRWIVEKLAVFIIRNSTHEDSLSKEIQTYEDSSSTKSHVDNSST
jgi:hypothetical protein